MSSSGDERDQERDRSTLYFAPQKQICTPHCGKEYAQVHTVNSFLKSELIPPPAPPDPRVQMVLEGCKLQHPGGCPNPATQRDCNREKCERGTDAMDLSLQGWT